MSNSQTFPLEKGKSYFLGYPTGRPGGISSPERKGTYIGFYHNRDFFVSRYDDKLELYSCPIPCQTVWISDGDDDCGVPAPNVSFARFAMPEEKKELERILAMPRS